MTLAPHNGERFPNGWPEPLFMDLDEDGGLLIQWIFGKQAAEDSWRVSFGWDPKEGAYAILTTHDTSELVEGAEAPKKIDEWLRMAGGPEKGTPR